MYFKGLIYSVLSFVIVILSSCNTCTEQMTAERSVKINFQTLAHTDSTLYNLSIKIYNQLKGDSLIIYNNLAALKISLPLNQNSNSTKFYLYTDSTSRHDSIIFFVKHDLELISPDCGFNTNFTLTDSIYYSHVRIDTILTRSLAITADLNTLNYTIVFKADTAR